jgi:hypothetical protein
MCFVVHKTISELEREILTIMYLSSVENTDISSTNICYHVIHLILVIVSIRLIG